MLEGEREREREREREGGKGEREREASSQHSPALAAPESRSAALKVENSRRPSLQPFSTPAPFPTAEIGQGQ